MADRPDHNLATELERSQNSYIAKMSDGHNSIIVRSKDDELAECYRLMGAAAARLRQLTDAVTFDATLIEANRSLGEEVVLLRRQLDTLRNAIGKLIPWAESYRMHHVVIALRELLALAAVGDPEEGRDEQ